MTYRDKKQVLLTGSIGFIGSNFLKKLTTKYNVIGINNVQDIKSHNYHPIKKNINKLKSNEIPNDLYSILHLAAITDTNFCEQYPQKCFDTNVCGTQNLLEIARKKDSKFVYVSTSHVYGAPNNLPILEEDPKKPLSMYATTKLAGEISCLGYGNSYGMDVSIARLFSVYGPKSPPHLVTSRIMSQIKGNFINLGNLYSERDFIFIDDVISALDIILRKTHGYNEYNVGTGKSYSIQKIYEIIKKLSKHQTPIKSSNRLFRKNDVKKIVCNPTKLKKLGWKPKTSIYSGLQQTWEWFDRNLIT
ncbi:MAG: GDP-mannose 4,6-dehydratase [Nitrosopumilus sp.]|nr:GDP-mannose 4,6-dehydratase [Nitrosopumilus sp.]